MITSLPASDLTRYIQLQVNNFFPDLNAVHSNQIIQSVDLALEKMDHCLSKAALNRYKKDGSPYFDHLFSDSYMLFLCYLANSVWQKTNDRVLSSKVYYLNKALHTFDCMYDNILPEIFFIVHGFGTMMGKAGYKDYFVIYQGCTIGATHGVYPTFGKGVSVTANASVIGNSIIGDMATISTRTTIFQKNIPEKNTAFINFDTGQLQVKPSKECYAQQFFNVDLNAV